MRPHSVLMRLNTKILFHAYEMVTTCTEHGVLSAGSKMNIANIVTAKETANWLASFTNKDSWLVPVLGVPKKNK